MEVFKSNGYVPACIYLCVFNIVINIYMCVFVYAYISILLKLFVLEIRFDLGNLADSGGAWRHNTVGKCQIEL